MSNFISQLKIVRRRRYSQRRRVEQTPDEVDEHVHLSGQEAIPIVAKATPIQCPVLQSINHLCFYSRVSLFS